MVNILEIKNNIVKVTFGLNIILLIVSIFFSSKAFIISALVVNIILNGTFIMMCKFGNIFDDNHGPLGNILGAVGGQLDNIMANGGSNGKIQR